MDIKTISSHNLIPVIDPAYLKQSPDEFLAENGGFLSEVVVVAKSTTGFVHYRSAMAPTDRESREFFSTFTTIADSIGIKVYAFVNGLADSYFAKNLGYSATKDGGNPSHDFVCPTKTSYANYLASIVAEITEFPVQGLIIDNIRYPHEEYCFCERCSRDFSNHSEIERIFSLGDIQRNNRLLGLWTNWRRDKIGAILDELSAVVKRKQNLSLSITLDIDPTLESARGALNQFGQDISVISGFGIPTIHLSAWTPFPSSTDSPEYKLLGSSLSFIEDFRLEGQTMDINLFLWGIENEASLTVIDKLKGEKNFKTAFVQNHFPADYRKRRETHLGLA